MKRTTAFCLLAAALALSGCAGTETTGPGPAADHEDYDALVARVEREIKRAEDKGFLWLYTESYLAQAREARKAGDTEKAVKLARKALNEALLAQKQAGDSAKIKPDYIHGR